MCVSKDKDMGNAKALDLVIEEWFDSQEKEQLENESNYLDSKELVRKLISINIIVNEVLEELESDRK